MKTSKLTEEQIALALRQLQVDNRKLKGLVAGLSLDRTILQDEIRQPVSLDGECVVDTRLHT